MKKYKVTVCSNSIYPYTFESSSRNAKQHAIEQVGAVGGAQCIVRTTNGEFVSGVLYSDEKRDFYYIFYGEGMLI